MAKRRKRRRFRGTPTDHAGSRDTWFRVSMSHAKAANDYLKKGDCRSALYQLLSAREANAKAEANDVWSESTLGAKRPVDLSKQLGEAANGFTATCMVK